MLSSPIYFYIPKKQWPSRPWPDRIEDYWDWMQVQQTKYPGAESWIVQTFLNLKAVHFPCELVGEMPDAGIICAHRFGLRDSQKPNDKQLFICTRDDKFIHPYAQLHVVQNARQAQPCSAAPLWASHYIPLWTQARLIPRGVERGDRFENIAYLGDLDSLAPELKHPDWAQQLESLGLKWVVANATGSWNDYSAVDAILAIRSFDRNRHRHKPASKLFNAWLAGVPAVLGRESAYRHERRSGLDYIEVDSVDSAVAALSRLQQDVALRRRMMANCAARAQTIQPRAIRQRWISFLEGRARHDYDRWCRMSPWMQEAFLEGRRFLLHKADGIWRRLPSP